MASGISPTCDGKVSAYVRGATFGGARIFASAIGAAFLWRASPGELLVGYSEEWGPAQMPAEEADCVLGALGLLHTKVKCVILEELGGDYPPAVSACWPGVCAVVFR